MPDSGFFKGKTENEIRLWFKNEIHKHMKMRDLSSNEVGIIKEIASDSFNLAIANHEKECAKNRKGGMRDWFSLIIAFISLLVSVGVLLTMIYGVIK